MKTICDKILHVIANQNHPDYYRQRSFAKNGLGQFQGQLADAKTAMDICVITLYDNRNEFVSAKTTHINNFILAICTCIENGVTAAVNKDRYSLGDAVYYYNDIWQNNRAFKYFKQTKVRIMAIDRKAFYKYR